MTAQQTAEPGVAQDSRSDGGDTRRLSAALLVAVIAFAVQQTAVVPAVDTIQSSLHSSAEWSAWLVTVYLIIATVATPGMGRLGDLHGRRRMLLIGLTVFAIGSVGAAVAPSMVVLILCRAIQGIGGAVYPLTLSIAREQVPPESVEKQVSTLTAAFGVGTALGFVSGGLLAEYLSWRGLFVAGAVLVALAAVLVWRVVPATRPTASGRFDVRGTVILTAASVALLSGLTLVVPLGWTSVVTIGLFVVAFAASVLWVMAERRSSDPLVDLHVLRDRRVAVANLSTVGLGWTLFASYLLIPKFSEAGGGDGRYGLGLSPAAVGFLLLPLAVGQTLAARGGSLLSRRVAARYVYAAGLALAAAAVAVLMADRSSLALTAFAAFLLGSGAGMALESASSIATQGVAQEVAAVSSAVNSTVRRLAGGVGGQTSTILLASLIGVSGQPRFSAFLLSYAIAGATCLAGVALTLFALPD